MKKVVSVETMRKSDAASCERFTAHTLMERAGKAIFEAVKWKPPVAVVCGKGNNGGDGYAVAALMKKSGIDCTLFVIEDKISPVSRPFFDNCVSLGVPVKYGVEGLDLTSFATVLDCIFGTGFCGEVKEPYRTAINRINISSAYVVCADINSGLGGDSGLFDVCVKSDLTVSVGDYKSGHFLNSAKDVIKAKVNCPIGIDILHEPAYLIEAEDIRHLFTGRRHNSNKGDYGYVAVIGGSVMYSGAAKLANLSASALRSGAGVVKLAVPESIKDGVMPYLLESTLFPLDCEGEEYRFSADTTEKLIARTAAVSVGMGMGQSGEVKKLVEYLLREYKGKLIIDADGLNVLSQMDRSLLRNAVCSVILTPHPKEFERLSGEKIEAFRGDLISAAKRYACDTGVILLLKGAATIITDGQRTYLADRGTPGMATAGSGDVLSGILTGMCGYLTEDTLLLGVSAGAYLAGLAGEIAAKAIPEAAMTASDTVKAIPEAMREIIEGK